MSKRETRVVVAGMPDEGGILRISETVLAEIAATEAAVTDGVVAGHEASRKGKDGHPTVQDVRVQVGSDEVVFHLTIGVRGGLRMPDVADVLRQRVAQAVRAKTGYTVRAVNVLVDRVTREAPSEGS